MDSGGASRSEGWWKRSEENMGRSWAAKAVQGSACT
jgi:hypothetical protein